MKNRTTPIAERRRRAYSYSRFSTPEQARGDSLRRQTSAAAAYAEAHNLDLDDKLSFRDLGVSAFRGKNAETGKLAEFIEAARIGVVEQGSVLLVENLDRISRLPALDAVNLLNDICKAGVSVVTLNNGVVYTKESLRTDIGSLLNAIIGASQGNLQNVDKSDRLRKAWEGKKEKARAKGKMEIITAMAPCWLKPNADRTGWVEDKAKVKIVKRIFDLTLKGVGVNKLAQDFNEQGVPAIGRPRRRRADAPGVGAPGKWQVTFIQKLLSNPAVIGEFHDHRREYDHDTRKYTRVSTGEVIKNYYPRIIDTAVFRKVAAQINGRKGKARARGAHLSNIFAGLSRCPRCGNSMSSVNKGNGSKVYLACAAAKLKAGCTYHAVRLQDVESTFLAAAEDLVTHIPSGDTKADSELLALERSIESSECALMEAKDIYRREPSRFLAGEIRKEEEELEAMQTRLRELASKVEAGSAKVLAARSRDLASVLPSPFNVVADDGTEKPAAVNREAINAILHRIFDHVVIDYDRGNLVIHWRNGAKTRLKYGKPMPRKKAA